MCIQKEVPFLANPTPVRRPSQSYMDEGAGRWLPIDSFCGPLSEVGPILVPLLPSRRVKSEPLVAEPLNLAMVRRQ